MLLAHSQNEEVPPQSYEDHINGVVHRASEILSSIQSYITESKLQHLRDIVLPAAYYHDMGKLCRFSQLVLRQEVIGNMPNHVDAGTAHLKNQNNDLSALLVHAHHLGFMFSPEYDLRDSGSIQKRCRWIYDYLGRKFNNYHEMMDYTDEILPELVSSHHKEVSTPEFTPVKWSTGLSMRMALSVLVSADHYDTAKNYNSFVIDKELPLRPKERLDQLFVNKQKLPEDAIKDLILNHCATSDIHGLSYLESPVGTGKTLSAIAYALNIAHKYNRRRILYVAPFTNIIDQTVDVLRDFILLDEEDPLETIAAHHHAVEFESNLSELHPAYLKKFTVDWHSPIICTTAVQFFETLTGVKTGKLKKLHQLAGSVIIIDESHACIPSHLWDLTLIILNELVQDYNCSVLFCSGSIVTPWKNEHVLRTTRLKPDGKRDELLKYCELPPIHSILPKELSEQLLSQEESRVPIEYNDRAHSLKSFCYWISSWRGPKVAVFNTVRNAALVADQLKKMEMDVIHISTALTPNDRKNILEKVKDKLYKRENFCLIATSCIESGVDISFQWGFRECSNLDAVLQLSGRVNRRREFTETGVQVFELKDVSDRGEFTRNPMYDRSSIFLREFILQNKVSPRFCVDFFDKCFLLPNPDVFTLPELERKLIFKDKCEALREENEEENEGDSVHKFYKVIAEEKKTVIIHEEELEEEVSKHVILANSIQIYETNFDKLVKDETIQESQKFPGLFKWNGAYDNFIGYQRHFIGTNIER